MNSLRQVLVLLCVVLAVGTPQVLPAAEGAVAWDELDANEQRVLQRFRDSWDELPPEQEAVPVLVTFLEAGSKINLEKLKLFIEHLETIQGIQKGLAEVDAGQSRPLSEFMAEMQTTQ